jgi:hypothetical protein
MRVNVNAPPNLQDGLSLAENRTFWGVVIAVLIAVGFVCFNATYLNSVSGREVSSGSACMGCAASTDVEQFFVGP